MGWINGIMLLCELYICWILTVEYYFDKKIYEQKRRHIKRTRNKVVVRVEDGQAIVTEQPREVDVVIESKS